MYILKHNSVYLNNILYSIVSNYLKHIKPNLENYNIYFFNNKISILCNNKMIFEYINKLNHNIIYKYNENIILDYNKKYEPSIITTPKKIIYCKNYFTLIIMHNNQSIFELDKLNHSYINKQFNKNKLLIIYYKFIYNYVSYNMIYKLYYIYYKVYKYNISKICHTKYKETIDLKYQRLIYYSNIYNCIN